MKYSMELTAEQRDILQGKQGDTLAKVMETLVALWRNIWCHLYGSYY